MKQLNEKGFVMDCSATICLLLQEKNQAEIKKIETLLLKMPPAYVPSLWRYEVANVLCMAERSQRISEANLHALNEILETMPILMDELASVKALDQTLEIARHHQLTVYDAAYLELAMREAIPLMTYDKALAKAASKTGVLLL